MSGECILSLDQSPSSTGWAVHSPDCDLVSGTWPLGDTKHRGRLYRQLWTNLLQAHEAHGLARIVHERPNFGMANKGEAQMLASTGLIATIELFCESRGIAVQGVASGSWRGTFFTKSERKAIRANGTWKRAAVERCRQLGFDPITDDEAEAIALVDHYLLSNQLQPYWRADDKILEALIG